MRWSLLAVLAALVVHGSASAAAPTAPGPRSMKTTVVVLGVEHAAQLVSRAYRPAVLEAFIARARPDALCVERDPDDFATGDFYEFTYEVSEVAVPYARKHGIDLCPIDWEPPKADQLLGFGVDLDAPPPVRPAEGFQAFLTFTDRADLSRDLFWAEDRTALKDWDNFADQVHPQPGAELSRRLFLYRTALQARRAAAAAHAHPGQTVLVLIGADHERDLKQVLAADPAIELVDARTVGAPEPAEVALHEAARYDLAALTFNILGLQAQRGPVDLAWMDSLLTGLDRSQATSAEVRLLRLRLDRLDGRRAPKATLKAYQDLLPAVPPDLHFTWTGLKDRGRLDSFFDPFAALTVRQRLQLEIAREFYALGQPAPAEAIRRQLGASLTGTRAAQFAAYWPRFVGSAAAMS